MRSRYTNCNLSDSGGDRIPAVFMDRTILHCDCNGFYASVECVLHPEYRNVPMAVCGNPENRHGIILAKNELAKAYGVQTAETIWQAKKKCPGLVLASAHHEEYERFSKRVNEIYLRYTDQVEPFSIDESWLDVGGSRELFGDGVQIADELRETVRRETGLTISVGVSFNKIFAKMGSDYKKPDATTVISRDNYKDILWPLPVSDLIYVGKSCAKTLQAMGIRTIGELACASPAYLCGRLGKLGETLYDYANGLEDSPVLTFDHKREIKSVGNGMTFRRDLVNTEEIELGLYVLSDEVAQRLRKYGLKCRTVSVTIKDTNLKVINRQKALMIPSQLSRDLWQASLELVHSSWNPNKPIRMLTVTAMNVVGEEEACWQASIFISEEMEQKRKKLEALETALDDIRQKYGQEAVKRASVLKNDLGISGALTEKQE